MGALWTKAVATCSVYSTRTLDVIAREVAYRLMQGRPPSFPTFDVSNCRMLVLMGTNPAVSHGHTQGFPLPVMRIREISRRGEVWVFDPRTSESAKVASRHVALRPGSDYAVLAYAIRELLRKGADEKFIARWTERVDVLREAVEPYTLEVAAGVAGVEPITLTEFVAAIRRAGTLAVVPGTGLGFGPNPAVAEWLAMTLNAVTGSIEAPGGIWFNPGFWNPAPGPADHAAAFEPAPGPPSRPDLRTWAVNGERPMVALADEIEAGNVKALIVLGGNPLCHSPDFEKVQRAYAQLDVLAIADVIEGDMTAVATHVFPATAQLERADRAVYDHLAFDVFGQYTQAVVQPRADRRPMWWFVIETARRMGLQLLPDAVDVNPSAEAILRHMFPKPRLPFDEMVASPGGRLVEADRGPWYTKHAMPTQRWDLAPELLVKSMQKIGSPADSLLLVSRRQRCKMNSVHRDLAQRGQVDEVGLFMNPEDAIDRGLAAGQMVVVRSESGSLTLPMRIDATMRAGVAAIPHGYRSANVNQLTDSRNLLDFTGMPRLSTIAITVESVSSSKRDAPATHARGSDASQSRA